MLALGVDRGALWIQHEGFAGSQDPVRPFPFKPLLCVDHQLPGQRVGGEARFALPCSTLLFFALLCLLTDRRSNKLPHLRHSCSYALCRVEMPVAKSVIISSNGRFPHHQVGDDHYE